MTAFNAKGVACKIDGAHCFGFTVHDFTVALVFLVSISSLQLCSEEML